MLASLPRLVGLDLYRIRQLQPGHLETLQPCSALQALALDALPAIIDLTPLDGPLASGLRSLHLDESNHVARCRTSPGVDAPPVHVVGDLLTCPSLRWVDVWGDVEPADIERFAREHGGDRVRLGDWTRQREGDGAVASWPDGVSGFRSLSS